MSVSGCSTSRALGAGTTCSNFRRWTIEELRRNREFEDGEHDG
jgi:hypothetical protein